MLNFAITFRTMKKFFKFLFIKLPLALIALSVLLVVIFKWAPVWVTPIMVHRSIQYRNDPDYHTSKKCVKLEDISPEMMKAVISSEDNLFCKHNGFGLSIVLLALLGELVLETLQVIGVLLLQVLQVGLSLGVIRH